MLNLDNFSALAIYNAKNYSILMTQAELHDLLVKALTFICILSNKAENLWESYGHLYNLLRAECAKMRSFIANAAAFLCCVLS